MKSSELKRWLTRMGATFISGKGSHLHVFLNGRRTIMPMHNREVSTGTFNQIKKDLGIKNREGK